LVRLPFYPVATGCATIAETMDLQVVGREAELAAVRAFVERADEGAVALVLEGEAGIGKSTLWRAGVAYASAREMQALSARPAEAESRLLYSGLADLFEGVLDGVLPELSTPRRRALEAALLLDETGDSIDERALVVAVRDALQLLAESAPVLIAVDDVQWLDASSSSALTFALRRLGDSPVFALAARRVTVGVAESVPEFALGAERVERVTVGGLSIGALHRILLDRIGRPFPRQTLLRIHDRSGGNPFYALELARALGADADPLEPLKVPETLDELVRVRLAGLPAETRDALAVASALGAPTESLLLRVGVEPGALDPGFAARVVERDSGTVRFTHPLLASALYPKPGEKRREVHRRIAGSFDDPVLRARHLALSVDRPSAKVAAAVEDAALRASDRGAFAIAAELAEQALRLTPAGGVERDRRVLDAARAEAAAGEWTRAKALLDELLAGRAVGLLRAEALVVLARLEGLGRGVILLEEALREAQTQPALQSVIHCQLAWTSRFAKGFPRALQHARAALELADEVDDDALRVPALARLAFLGAAVGDGEARAYATRADEIAVASGDATLVRRARLALCEVVDDDAARVLLECVYEEARERDELVAAEALNGLAWVELSAQRWALAAEYAERASDLMTQYGLEVPWALLPISVVAAHRGELELAREHSERSLQLAEAQFGLHTPVHLGTLGFVAAQRGDRETAARWFAEAEAVTTRLGWRNAARRWWVADQFEVLLELERIDEAEHVLDTWESERKPDDERTRAHVSRSRGLLEAARGNSRQAVALLTEAVGQHEAAGDTFGRGRALLALGAAGRRERQKRPARDAIAAALADFEKVGAATWSAKARAELGRIGGRTRTEGLTAAERRVAALVAEGRTNREVAAALFLGERTVETHLSHVYAKLGVRSRTELARRFRSEEQTSGGLTISN
jgi:DNA-binding CsgD family transcriptional regulator